MKEFIIKQVSKLTIVFKDESILLDLIKTKGLYINGICIGSLNDLSLYICKMYYMDSVLNEQYAVDAEFIDIEGIGRFFPCEDSFRIDHEDFGEIILTEEDYTECDGITKIEEE